MFGEAIRAIKQPISGQQSAGRPIRLEPAFDTLQAEINKLDSLDRSAQIDWSLIKATAHKILAQESKDLLVVCYLTRALTEEALYAGLAAGLRCLLELCEQYWETCFPPKKRARARGAALNWLAEKVLYQVESEPPGAGDSLHLKDSGLLLKKLDTFLGAELGDEAPLLRDLSKALARYEVAALSERAQSEVASQGLAPRVADRDPSFGPKSLGRNIGEQAVLANERTFSKTGSERDVRMGMRACQERIKAASDWLLAQDLKDPLAYRLNAIAAWLPVKGLPAHQEGLSVLRALPMDKRASYESSLDAKHYAQCLPALENSFFRTPFWLDAHRLVAQALTGLGAPAAREAVIQRLRDFVELWPAVLELKFADAVPFADEQTKQWIATEVLAPVEPEPQEPVEYAGVESTQEELWLDAAVKARSLFKQKKLHEALALFSAGVSSCAKPREKFVWQLSQAAFCVEIKRVELATPVLEKLYAQLDDTLLADWECELSKRVMVLLSQCYRRMPKGHRHEERQQAVYARLCGVDVAMALAVG